MNSTEVALLRRAHDLFAAPAGARLPDVAVTRTPAAPAGLEAYRLAAHRADRALTVARRTDAALDQTLRQAVQDHDEARTRTRETVDEAVADGPGNPASPLAQREALRRRVARLRAQHRHVLRAQRRARRHAAALRGLRYRGRRRRRRGPARPGSRAAAAVRAALSRLGRPYVWGATGPDSFDCSGLVQWAYARAGVALDRTTYEQLSDGVAVPRSQVRPGDLVFPHPGHVQLAIGHDRVVEASHPGAPVRIAPLGSHVQIRRPT
ncbi:hypothetical protein AWC30_01220 [Mycolicibacillus trivialis]|uniref:NlpC/P60 domain-containing protein n=2 Tax=Mycolicibacillus trivialis TaxID=1798 RepID=A0A1X2EDY3_9MYCO|nr:C40 family peptidase [Mycolicibacillus trivialis]ORW98827.1 hypothetical protein AWC30_01220 [Mycolicibacillus trivialis]